MSYYVIQRGYSFPLVLNMRLEIIWKWSMARRQVVMAMSSKPHFENKARERLEVTRKWLIARHVVIAMSA